MARRASIVALGFAVLELFGVGALLAFSLASGTSGPVAADAGPIVLVLAVAFLAVATTILWREPANRFGWWMWVLGLQLLSGLLLRGFADYSTHVTELPGAAAAAWLATVLNTLLVPLVAALLLIFPTGRVAGRRWRWVGVAVTVDATLGALVAAVKPGLLEGGLYENPLGVALPGISFLETTAVGAQMGCLLLAVVSVAARWRRADGVQRQQLKCVAAAASVWPVLIVVLVSLPASISDGPVGEATFGSGVVALAVAVGVAILRYRLYDIDRVVSRTVSYVVITGILVGVYVGCVSLLTDVLPFDGDVGTAASVLVAVALFAPLRHRVQKLVDRRFNRARYDASAVTAAFGARLREQVDLDVVSDGLLDAVAATVQPAHASLWLRSAR